MYRIKITNLYGLHDGHCAYYRKLGDCFDFVNDVKYSSELTGEEVEKIMSYRDWYLNQYKAEEMLIEEIV